MELPNLMAWFLSESIDLPNIFHSQWQFTIISENQNPLYFHKSPYNFHAIFSDATGKGNYQASRIIIEKNFPFRYSFSVGMTTDLQECNVSLFR